MARKARELVGRDGHALLEFWLEVLADKQGKVSDRLEASRLLADRGFGKAASFAPIEEEDPLGLAEARSELVRRLERVAPLP